MATERVEEPGDYRCMARNNGTEEDGEGGGGGPNGQSDERCAIIASAKIGSRQDARPVEILRFVVARKNPEDWLKEAGQGGQGGGRWRGMRAMVTSGFAMRQPVCSTCRPAAPTHPQERRDRYFRYDGEFSKKKK